MAAVNTLAAPDTEAALTITAANVRRALNKCDLTKIIEAAETGGEISQDITAWPEIYRILHAVSPRLPKYLAPDVPQDGLSRQISDKYYKYMHKNLVKALRNTHAYIGVIPSDMQDLIVDNLIRVTGHGGYRELHFLGVICSLHNASCEMHAGNSYVEFYWPKGKWSTMLYFNKPGESARKITVNRVEVQGDFVKQYPDYAASITYFVKTCQARSVQFHEEVLDTLYWM